MPRQEALAGRDETETTARHLLQQAATLYPRSSTSTNVSPWGLSRRVWQEAVQPAVRSSKRR